MHVPKQMCHGKFAERAEEGTCVGIDREDDHCVLMTGSRKIIISTDLSFHVSSIMFENLDEANTHITD